MIRYRYDMTIDSEPHGDVRLAISWPRGGTAYWQPWVWRNHCGRNRDTPPSRRGEAGGKWGRWKRHGLKHTWSRGRKCDTNDQGSHYHWTDGDKTRAWGSFRGTTDVINLDAFRKLHTDYHRRQRRRRGYR